VRVLLVEDDPRLGPLLARALETDAHEVTLAVSRGSAEALVLDPFEVAVVDWMLPDGDGLDLCVRFRSSGFTAPVLMLTARGETRDRVKALDTAVDDYLVKPFEMDELLARVRALGRRGTQSAGLDAGPLHIDIWARHVFANEKLLPPFGTTELDLLVYLARRAERAVPKHELLSSVWEGDDQSSSLLQVAIFRLREKLGEHAWMVETVRGEGYRLRTTRPAS
jgi:DNA-binding response OmpR family regulator